MSVAKSPIIRKRSISHTRYQTAIDAGMSPVISRVLASRSWSQDSCDDPRTQTRPPITQLSSPELLADMEVAANRLAIAIMTGESIAIETDHDVDGVTSHAVLKTALVEYFGHPAEQVCSFIGHRLKEGYGLSQSVAERILSSEISPSLVVTADNGSADEPRIAFLKDHGIETIVTDHHEIPASGIPASAAAVINPTRDDCHYPDPLIAGCMVAWLLACRTRRLLVEYGHLSDSAPKMGGLLDYVCVGTIADCVSIGLSLNNRIVIRQGLASINAQSRWCWHVARLNLLGPESPVALNAQDIGFGIGPRINARGRLDEAMAGVAFLLSDTEDQALQYWDLLDQENQSRKEIEKSLKDQAFSEAEQAIGRGVKGIAVWLEDGHPGVHGIVASRVVEAFGCPTVCLSPVHGKEQELVTGSARGIPGFNVKEAFDAIDASNPGLFEKFGGHEGAGGLTISRDRVATLQRAWEGEAERQGRDKDIEFAPIIWSDGELDAPSLDLVYEMARELSPFGREFEEPAFEADLTVDHIKPVGDGSHLKLIVHNDTGRYQAIWFSACPPTEKGAKTWPVQQGQTHRFVYVMDDNYFNGSNSLQLRIVTAWSPSPPKR